MPGWELAGEFQSRMDGALACTLRLRHDAQATLAGPELEVVLALHGRETDAPISQSDRIKVIEADPRLMLGEVLQRAVEASTGE